MRAKLLCTFGPRADELLTSWLVRLSRANRLKVHTFCDLLWPHRQIWPRDADWSSDPVAMDILAKETGTPIDQARATILKKFEGTLFEQHRPNAKTAWIRPIGVHHRTRRRAGLQFCPGCLSEDRTPGEDPRFRLSWRVAFIATCPKHGRVLLESCPNCGAPVNFHRLDIRQALWICASCGFDLRRSQSALAAPDAIAFQESLSHASDTGMADLGIYGPTHGLAFFAVVHRLMRLIASGKAAAGLRRFVERESGVRFVEPITRGIATREIEMLPPSTRHDLLRTTAVLIEAWPERFLEACSRERVWSSSALRDVERRSDAPYAFIAPVRGALDRTFYVPNADEVEAMRNYLRRKGTEPTVTALRRLSGLDSKAFRYRV